MNAADTIQQQARRPLPSPNQVHPNAGDRNAGFGTIRGVAPGLRLACRPHGFHGPTPEKRFGVIRVI